MLLVQLTAALLCCFVPAAAFVVAPSASLQHGSTKSALFLPFKMMMVRNIDLPEALILYGYNAICDPVVADTAREGLSALLQECHEIQTAVIVLLETASGASTTTTAMTATLSEARHFLETVLPEHVARPCHVFLQTQAPPNPLDLLNALSSITVQPRAFGGSAGFGSSQHADPERLVEAKHCVVLTSTVDQTRAARAVGMRVLSVHQDDDLADAVLFSDEIDFWLDDIATPGSFWLNPPHPRDDHGNKVDPYRLVELYGNNYDYHQRSCCGGAASTGIDDESVKVQASDMDDDAFKAILEDLAPL